MRILSEDDIMASLLQLHGYLKLSEYFAAGVVAANVAANIVNNANENNNNNNNNNNVDNINSNSQVCMDRNTKRS